MKMEMMVADGKHDDAFSRRGALAALAGAVLSPALKPAFADDAGEEVVVQGEMRFEEGTEKKMAKIGGKGTCVVTLRCVGKGIISETKFNVDAAQFPKPGKPPKGQEVGGGVPFVVKVKDLRVKTEKGRTVDRDLWGDDDIFVRVDIRDGVSDKKIASGLGKAKYLFDTKKHAASFVLLE